MNIKIKLLNNGQMPQKKTVGAACFDCYSNENVTLIPGETKIIKLGFAVEVPNGFYAEMRGRSGLSSKGLLCSIGTVDADYRGEVGAIITNLTGEFFKICKGERICQMMIKQVIETELVEAQELTDTERGCGGFGSTGV